MAISPVTPAPKILLSNHSLKWNGEKHPYLVRSCSRIHRLAIVVIQSITRKHWSGKVPSQHRIRSRQSNIPRILAFFRTDLTVVPKAWELHIIHVNHPVSLPDRGISHSMYLMQWEFNGAGLLTDALHHQIGRHRLIDDLFRSSKGLGHHGYSREINVSRQGARSRLATNKEEWFPNTAHAPVKASHCHNPDNEPFLFSRVNAIRFFRRR